VISDHQVVAFVRWRDGLYAVEGIDHLGLAHGSLIRISRGESEQRWRAAVAIVLPSAPFAVSSCRDGTLLITLSDGILSIAPDHSMNRLLVSTALGRLYPTSSALTGDEQRLYVGMRQFVGEFTLATRSMRYLIPTTEYLNRLPKDVESRVREVYREYK
jgi:hypothetical protein